MRSDGRMDTLPIMNVRLNRKLYPTAMQDCRLCLPLAPKLEVYRMKKFSRRQYIRRREIERADAVSLACHPHQCSSLSNPLYQCGHRL